MVLSISLDGHRDPGGEPDGARADGDADAARQRLNGRGVRGGDVQAVGARGRGGDAGRAGDMGVAGVVDDVDGDGPAQGDVDARPVPTAAEPATVMLLIWPVYVVLTSIWLALRLPVTFSMAARTML